MPEIGTSGSMSGDGKRSVAAWPKLPRPSSTLPDRHPLRRTNFRSLSEDLRTCGEPVAGIGPALTRADIGRIEILHCSGRGGTPWRAAIVWGWRPAAVSLP